ncbi:MAG: radical SAM/SPASM domain-containing protein [Planctomycetaceae bacterium]|nr:radical SAM protein [Planctomycetaceae bacterium]
MGIHDLSSSEKTAARRQYQQPDFPFVCGISLGEYPCNRRCRMCPMYTAPPKVERYITDEILEQACRQVGQRKVNLELSAYGETFMHPRADEYLFTARRMCPNAQIVVATNGALLTRERCEKIVDSGIDHLSFSLDAGSAESYQWLTGTSDYDDVCRNLETLAAVRDQRGGKHLRITTHIIGIKELAHEFEAFEARWKGIVDSAVVRPYGNWAGMVNDNGVTPAQKQEIPAERYPCAWLWYATKIEPNGDVSKCFVHITGDLHPVGNIMQEPLESIWRGEKMNRLRELHMTNRCGELDLCPDCIVWSLFPKFWKQRKRLGLFKTGEWK